MARNAGGTVRPMLAGGSISGVPDTHSSTTVSPDCTVSSGGKLASNSPQRVVSGEAGMRCVAKGRTSGTDPAILPLWPGRSRVSAAAYTTKPRAE